MAIQDHRQTEEYLSSEKVSVEVNNLSLSNSGIENTAALENPQEKAFDQLRSLCINTNARESFAVSNHPLELSKAQIFIAYPVPSYVRDKIGLRLKLADVCDTCADYDCRFSNNGIRGIEIQPYLSVGFTAHCVMEAVIATQP